MLGTEKCLMNFSYWYYYFLGNMTCFCVFFLRGGGVSRGN